MMRSILGICLTILACCEANAQPGAPSPTFEVASVKPSLPPSPDRGMVMTAGGGPGTKDPGRIDWRNMSMMSVLMQAYDVKNYQISGPDWLSGTRFDITATIPQDATKEQFRLMLQNLLTERFKLSIHRDKKELVVYSLVVGKNGPKMKESADDPAPAEGTAAPPPPSGPVKMQKDQDGFPIFPGRKGTFISMTNGRFHIQAKQETMAQFVSMLTNQLNRPVTDATGLKGKYDFALTYTPVGMTARPASSPQTDGALAAIAETDSDPDIFGAMPQIGLKLEPKKGMIDLIVVDHLEKVPTEN